MKIVKVSVTVSRTVSLPEYSNARFGLSLEADVTDGEDAFVVADALRKDAADYVEEQCNQALEVEGQPAKFYEGELYDVVVFLNSVLITQHGINPSNTLPPSYRKLYTGHRWNGAVTLASREAEKRGFSFDAHSTLIGEPLALEAKMRELAEQSGAWAAYEVGRVRRDSRFVYRHAIIPLTQVVCDPERMGYYVFPDLDAAKDHIAHDYRPSELVVVQSVEELDDLYDADEKGDEVE